MPVVKFTSKITLFTDVPQGLYRVLATRSGSAAVPNTVIPVNDLMRIINNTGGTITLTGFNGTHFVSLSTITLTNGQSVDLVIKSGASLTTGNFSINYTGYTSKTYYYSVVSAIDTQPDTFSLGADIVDAIATDYYYANSITISGVNQNITVSVSATGGGSAVFQKNGTGSWVTSNGSVSSGDVIQVRITAASGNGIATSVTLSAGSPIVSDIINVTTRVNPAVGTPIMSPYGLPLGLLSVCNFLGNAGKNLLPLYKGGSFVPNIGQNSGVSTSQNSVSLKNLANVYTEISFQKARTKFFFYDNVAGGTALITWNTALNGALDPDIIYGYHPDIAGSMQFYATLTQISGSGVALTSGDGLTNPWSWSANNLIFNLTLNVPTNNNTTWRGYITLYARHNDVPTVVINTKLNYTISGVTGIPSPSGGEYNVP